MRWAVAITLNTLLALLKPFLFPPRVRSLSGGILAGAHQHRAARSAGITPPPGGYGWGGQRKSGSKGERESEREREPGVRGGDGGIDQER